jgi:2'-5' RNA ligase
VLAAADRQWIESIRARHDPQASLIPLHVTLVFPTADGPTGAAAEVESVGKAFSAVPFVIRWARPVRDIVGAGGHVFLVPDEGFDGISALHNALYSEGFGPTRLPDVLFIPHITVGASPDFAVCETIARDLSPLERQVRGRLETLDLIEVHAGRVKSLCQWRLEA